MATVPATPAPPAAPSYALLRDDTQVLMSYIQSARAVAIGRERALRDLRKWLMGRIILCAAVMVVTFAIWQSIGALGAWKSDENIATYCTAAQALTGMAFLAAVGGVGAVVSIGGRVSDAATGNIMAGDPMYDLASLGYGRSSLRLAIWSATVFAIVLYAFFASGLPATLGFSGGLAPVFLEVERNEARNRRTVLEAEAFRLQTAQETAAKALKVCISASAAAAAKSPVKADEVTTTPPPAPVCVAEQSDVKAATRASQAASDTASKAGGASIVFRRADAKFGTWLNSVADTLGLATVPDLFKLLVWIFLAGWSERLLPDMLDSLIKRRQANEQQQITKGGTTP